MRVLFTTWASGAHLVPMVPLARALLGAGHQVRVAVPSECAAAVAPHRPACRCRSCVPAHRRWSGHDEMRRNAGHRVLASGIFRPHMPQAHACRQSGNSPLRISSRPNSTIFLA
ncbi:hypothetical protein SANTM175S_08038 [Streptomyces antimycoticus]